MIKHLVLWGSYLLFLIDLFIFDGTGMIKVNIQDITSIIAVFIVIKYLLNSYDLKKKFVFPYAIYFGYLLITNLVIRLLLVDNNVFLFYILKEIIYYIIMIISYLCIRKNKELANKLLNYIIFINILYGVLSVVTGSVAYYGIGSINSDAPSQSGMIYLGCVMLSYFLYLDSKKRKYIFYIILTFLLVLLTVSRTAILGVIIFMITLGLLKVLSNIRSKSRLSLKSIIIITLITMISFLAIIILIYSDGVEYSNNYIFTIFNRFNAFNSSLSNRLRRLELFTLDKGNDIFKLLIGYGKGTPELILNRKGLAVDSQYFRLYLEMGIIGTLLWTSILFKTVMNVSKNQNPYYKRFSIAFTVSFLAMGFGFEIFQVTKAGSLFWLVQGLIIAASESNNANNELKNI